MATSPVTYDRIISIMQDLRRPPALWAPADSRIYTAREAL